MFAGTMLAEKLLLAADVSTAGRTQAKHGQKKARTVADARLAL
jgi:hypothetical protein